MILGQSSLNRLRHRLQRVVLPYQYHQGIFKGTYAAPHCPPTSPAFRHYHSPNRSLSRDPGSDGLGKLTNKLSSEPRAYTGCTSEDLGVRGFLSAHQLALAGVQKLRLSGV